MYDTGMAELAEAIESYEIGGDADSLREAFGLLDRLTAKVVTAVAAFESSGQWADEGATSMVAWLRHHAGQTARDAGWTVRAARLLSRLPATRSAWLGGDLSGGQVRAVVANVATPTTGLFADHEESVVGAVAGLSVTETARAMRHWARCAEAVTDGTAPAERRGLRLSPDLDGGVDVAGRLGAEGGAVVTAAVRLAESPDVDGEPARSSPERRADALVDLCRFYLDHQTARRGGRRRAHLNVVVDVDRLGRRAGGEVLDGPALDAATVDRLFCDSTLHRVMTAGPAVLDYGTAVRSVPAPLWAAVLVRDRQCRFPGCDRGAGWCEAHHVVPAAQGGPTRLDNLVVLCTRHHHLCHRPGWQAKLRPDGHFHVTAPAGRVLTSEPPAAVRGPPRGEAASVTPAAPPG